MVKVWNKIESINGVNAEIVIESHKIKDSDEIFLVIDDMSNRVTEVQFKHIICANYNIDISLTCLQVAQEYLRLKALEEEQAQKEQIILEEQAVKLDNLTEVVKGNINEISAVRTEQAVQDLYIQATQEVVDFLMLVSAPMSTANIKQGGNTMALYIAIRIVEKGKVSEKAGQDYYVTFLTHPSYKGYKSEVDAILIADGHENLIVPLD